MNRGGDAEAGTVAEVANSMERNKIRDALFEQYKLSIPQ